MPHQVEITGSLQVGLDGERTIDVTANGSRVTAEVGDLASGRTPLRFLRSRYVFARRLSRVLDRRALTLVLTNDGEPVAEFGSGVRGGLFDRLVGLARVRRYRKKQP